MSLPVSNSADWQSGTLLFGVDDAGGRLRSFDYRSADDGRALAGCSTSHPRTCVWRKASITATADCSSGSKGILRIAMESLVACRR